MASLYRVFKSQVAITMPAVVTRKSTRARIPLGQFRLDDVGNVVFFRGLGFRPSTRVLTSDEPLTVKLEEDVTSAWRLATCDALPPGHKSLGAIGRLSVPQNAKIKRSGGDDTWEDMIFYRRDRGQSLRAWLGPGNYDPEPLFGGFVRENWILDSSDISERTLSFGKQIYGVDTSGRDRTGRRWRWIVTQAGVTYYHAATNEAASFFDGILETACIAPN